jgi:hypothetical protein
MGEAERAKAHGRFLSESDIGRNSREEYGGIREPVVVALAGIVDYEGRMTSFHSEDRR